MYIRIYFNEYICEKNLEARPWGQKYDNQVANKKEVIPGGRRENKSREKSRF